jgi:hypothetical protein
MESWLFRRNTQTCTASLLKTVKLDCWVQMLVFSRLLPTKHSYDCQMSGTVKISVMFTKEGCPRTHSVFLKTIFNVLEIITYLIKVCHWRTSGVLPCWLVRWVTELYSNAHAACLLPSLVPSRAFVGCAHLRTFLKSFVKLYKGATMAALLHRL